MKSFKYISALLLVAVIGFSFMPRPAEGDLQIGDFFPLLHKKVKDVSGSEQMIREMGKRNGYLIIFSCNTCPFVMQWENRYNDLHKLAEANDISMILVNSNEANRNSYDSFENMQKKATEMGYTMPYVVDENHELADAFGAKTTPHVFLFDRNYRLAYRGLIDDNSEDKDAVTKHYLQDAINNMVAGKSIEPQVTKSIGCSIKRVKPE